MARTDTLPNFLTDVADAIREKKGSSDTILASDFDTEIENLPSGGGADLSEYFNNTLTENKTTYTPKWDYIKKIPNLIVGDNVTQLSYLFQRNYFKILTGDPKVIPKVICNDNVTNMSYMYYSMGNSVTSIDLSGLNTSNVTNMSSMFSSSGYLTSLDLSGFNTSRVTNITNMFSGLSNISSLDLSSFDFSKVTALSSTFNNCGNLLSLDLKNLIGESLGSPFTLNNVFGNCYKITKIDLSNLNPSVKNLDTRNMFQQCFKLEEIYLDKLDLGAWSITGYYSNMFNNCGSQLTDGAVTKVYVKDADAQNWILTASNGHPNTWTTDNVIIAGSAEDLRGSE